MRRNKLVCALACAFLCFLLLPIRAFATETDTTDITSSDLEDITFIYDDADLLTSSEEEELTKLCNSYYDTLDTVMYIISHNDADAEKAYYYVEDFFDAHDNYENAIVLVIDMVNRDFVIQGYGLCETYIHSKRIDTITDAITPDLSAKDYYSAFSIYLNMCAEYMQDDSVLNYDHNYDYANDPTGNTPNDMYHTGYTGNEPKPIYVNPLFQIVFSLIVGGCIVGAMVYNSGGRVTTNSRTYLNTSSSRLVSKQDQYIRTSVTKIRKPQNNNTSNGGRSGGGFNSGGFSGGRSSGGHSHSSGGGKF